MAYLGKTPPITLVKFKGVSLTLSERSQSTCKVQNGSERMGLQWISSHGWEMWLRNTFRKYSLRKNKYLGQTLLARTLCILYRDRKHNLQKQLKVCGNISPPASQVPRERRESKKVKTPATLVVNNNFIIPMGFGLWSSSGHDSDETLSPETLQKTRPALKKYKINKKKQGHCCYYFGHF